MVTVSKRRIEPWFYIFGLLTGVLNSGDSLTTVFAIVALGAGVALGGASDAVENAALIVGSLLFGRLADKLHKLKSSIIKLFLGLAVLLGLFAVTRNPVMFLGLTIILGVLLPAPFPIGSTLITRLFPPHEWASKYGALNASSFFGVVLFLGLTVLGLSMLPFWVGAEEAVRLLFLSGGFLALLGAVAIAIWVKDLTMAPARSYARTYFPRSLHRGGEMQEDIPVTSPSVLNDQLIVLYLGTILSFFGIGMAVSALPFYLTKALGASAQIVPLILLAFFLASAIASMKLSDIVTRLSPLRALAMATAFRSVCILMVPVFGYFLPTTAAILTTGLLIALTGGAGGIMSIASEVRIATLAHPTKSGAAMGLFSAATNLGLLMGALAGAFIGNFISLEILFILGAVLVTFGYTLFLKL